MSIPTTATEAELKICTLGADAYALRMGHPACDYFFNMPDIILDVCFIIWCQQHFLCLVQQWVVHDAFGINSSLFEIIEVVEYLVQVGILHLFGLFDLVQFQDAISAFHKIDADGVVDGDIFFVFTISVFVEHFAYADVIVLVLKCDVVGKKPEFGVADVKVVYLDTCDFHGGCGGWR